jgi:hypothetical protein
MPLDIKKDSVKIYYLKGYSSLIIFIINNKDKSTAIYRYFNKLSI